MTVHVKLLCFALGCCAVLLLQCIHFTPDHPIIKTSGETYVLHLPPKMARALQRQIPGFRSWSQADFMPSVVRDYPFTPLQAPFAVISDFNADGVQDLALAGSDKRRSLLLALVSEGQAFRIIVVDSGAAVDPRTTTYDGETGLGIYLAGLPDGRIEALSGESIEIHGDAFEEIYYDKGASAYLYEDGIFKEHLIGD